MKRLQSTAGLEPPNDENGGLEVTQIERCVSSLAEAENTTSDSATDIRGGSMGSTRDNQVAVMINKPQRTTMDIKTLEALGITPETLGNRIVDQAVEVLLSTNGFDSDTDQESRYESQFKKAIGTKIQQAVDGKIAALAAEYLVPRVGELIEKADMCKTNCYGEARTPSMSFKEYLAYRAETYMVEVVDSNGNSKADLEAKHESPYYWHPCGPRLSVLMKLHLKETMEKTAKEALAEVNEAVAKNMEEAAKDAIKKAAAAIKVSVST